MGETSEVDFAEGFTNRQKLLQKEEIAMDQYYLYLIKPNESKQFGSGWLFHWFRPDGKKSKSIQIEVSMDGKAVIIN